jgi:MraZ protein
VIKDQAFKGIVAFRSYRESCVEACAMDRMERMSDSVDALDMFSDEHDDLASTIFADSHQLPLDGDGRIILPAALIEHAEITDAAAFVGRGNTFQIWNPDAITRHQADARARVGRRGATLRLTPNSPDSGGN